MNYSEMSDDKINLQVFELLFGKFGEDRDMVRVWQQGKFQPCNSWSDAGPIIEKENISLTCHQSRDEWAAIFNRHAMAAHSNPLRAAMECFLMKKERENAA